MSDIYTMHAPDKRVAIVLAENELVARKMLRAIRPDWPERKARAFRKNIDCGNVHGVIFIGRIE
jgi:hypothetical protein